MPQDFSGQNLRGRSFKGQNLDSANFSYGDIRSADFTGANLIGANFKGAKAGLQRRWTFLLVLISWLLAGISGFFSAFAGVWVSITFASDSSNQFTGWISLIVMIVLFTVIIRQGINVTVGVAFSFAFAGFVGVGVVVAVVVFFARAVAGDFAFSATVTPGAVGFIIGLTGAFIVGLTGAIKLNPDPLRKPDNREEVFKDGDFADFIQPIFDTLDLYHNQGVDPRAIAIAFKTLAENNPDAELEIVAMEKRGQDKFLLRARTAVTTDKSELSIEYFDNYNQVKGLPEREIILLLSEKDSRIRSLETMVITALEHPNFYSNTQVGTVSTMTNNPGGFSVGGSIGGNVNNVQGDNNRTIQGDNNQGVLGDNNQVTQRSQVGGDTSLTKDEVVKLLAQLETLVKTAEIPAETKEEVIEDLDSAKKATDKEEPNKNRALERLGSVAETLEKTSKGVDAGQKIWTTAKPIIVKIATWLGAAAGSHLLGL